MVPVGQENLRLPVRRAAGSPGQLCAVGREHWQTVEAVGERHPHRLARAFRIHEEQLEIREAELVRRENQVTPGRMEKGRPGHRPEIGEPPLIGTVKLHREHVRRVAFLGEPPPENALAVGREKRPAIVAGRVGEPPDLRSVGLHQIDFAEAGEIGFESFAVRSGKIVRGIGVAQ